MCSECGLTVMDVDSGCSAIAVSCNKCRQIAFYTDADTAGRAGAHHAIECGTDELLIVELMSP